MSYAVMFPDSDNKGGRGNKGCIEYTVSKEYISKARHVLRNAPQFVTEIMAGVMPLSDELSNRITSI